MISVTSVFERLDAHSSKPLVECWLILRIIVQFFCNTIEHGVQVKQNSFAAVGHDCCSSRWFHYHLSSLTTTFSVPVVLHWTGICRMSCKWTALLMFTPGLFSKRLSRPWVQLRHILAVPIRFTRSIQAVTIGRLNHVPISHVDGIETAAACRAWVFDPISCLHCHWRGSSLYLVPCTHKFDIKVSWAYLLDQGGGSLGWKTEVFYDVCCIKTYYGYYCRGNNDLCMHIWSM